MAKVPEFITTEDYKFGPLNDERVLPKGSFIKPIDVYYLPKHCYNYPTTMYYNKDRDVFIYCRFGIITIPKKLVLEITW